MHSVKFFCGNTSFVSLPDSDVKLLFYKKDKLGVSNCKKISAQLETFFFLVPLVFLPLRQFSLKTALGENYKCKKIRNILFEKFAVF